MKISFYQIKEGDHKAFEEFFHAYYKPLFQLAYQYLKDTEDAEELVQDFFVNLWDKRKTLEITNLKGYCLIAIRNRALNLKSRSDKMRPFMGLEKLEDHIADQKIDTTVPLEVKELSGLIQQAISQLPDRCREVFVLCREEMLTYDQVASRLGIGKETVKSQMKTALHRIKTFLSEHGEGLSVVLPAFFIFFRKF